MIAAVPMLLHKEPFDRKRTVVDCKLDAAVDDWCQRLLLSSPQSLRLSDMMLNSVRQGFETLSYIHDTAEFHEGTAAFLEKRPPKF